MTLIDTSVIECGSALKRYQDFRLRRFEAETYLFGILHFASCEKRDIIVELAKKFMPNYDFDRLIESLKNEGLIKQTHSILLMNKKHPDAQNFCAEAFGMHLEAFSKEVLGVQTFKTREGE
jgi:hypothetical protein